MLAEGAATATAGLRRLTVATWNVAAVNNNPFEYWLTVPDAPAYGRLMSDVESFLEDPGSDDRDVPVRDVFTDVMYDGLEARMAGTAGWGDALPVVRRMWVDDYRDRRIVSGFMRDPTLGSKRLASMPDRVTNTIDVAGGDGPACRPTVISMYDGDLSTLDSWWGAWTSFMFDEPLTVRTGDGGTVTRRPYEMLRPIRRSKYPDVTEEEEAVSLPLQTVCGAVFDAILVHMMNTVSTPDVWQPLKRRIADGLVRDKVPNTLKILEEAYADADIITLQEVSLALVDRARSSNLGELFHVLAPADADPSRDQNSVILLRRESFPSVDGAREITRLVEAELGEGAPVARGDILAVEVEDRDGAPYLVASFHGDTDGLATEPVLDAVIKALISDGPPSGGRRLIFGLDANTYEHPKPGRQADVRSFGRRFAHHGLSSCWGPEPQPSNYTTFNARTYLQPQLNKACRSSDKRGGGDVNPKDFVLFQAGRFDVARTWKDNTGRREYVEEVPFPTLEFPSDHGIVGTVLEAKAAGGDGEGTCSS